MTETTDAIVIGAGVIGLAVARELAMHGRQVTVIERNETIGQETSSRNSEVIHAGIYYPRNSLKARLCVAGKERLYAYCREKDIPHERCGKVIVAVGEAEVPALRDLHERARANGVDDLEWLDRAALGEREPAVSGAAGLWSPSSGIIDSHAFMLALQGDLEHHGGAVAFVSEFRGGSFEGDSIRLRVASGGGQVSEIEARTVVNAAGLQASRVAHTLAGGGAARIPETRYAKGSYFLYDGPSPFNHLVYPLPVAGGLGIHATHDMAGSLRFGPDVEWIDSLDYAVDGSRAARFADAVRTWWPELDAARLTPGYAGVRPKLSAPGDPPADFAIIGPVGPGSAELVHLLGFESPGLTAALATAEGVRKRLE